MGFLSNLFSKQATNSTSVVRTLCEVLRPLIGQNGEYSDSTAPSDFRGWVYVAANYNATQVANSDIRLFANKTPRVAIGKQINKNLIKTIRSYGIKAMKEAVEIEDHPIIDLLHSPNEDDSLHSFLYKIDLFLELVGDAYILIERAENGIPIALYVLFSQYVTIQNDGGGRIVSYNYGIPRDGRFQYKYSPEDIIHIKWFDPNDQYYGISPFEASARSNGLIKSMDTYEEALNRNLGIPSGVLKYNNQKINEADRELVESKWQGKFSSVGRSGKVVVTDQDVTYDVIGVSPRDMQFLDGRKWSREEILSCFGIPQALLITEKVNRSNMVQSTINYHNNTLTPRLKLISQTLTNQLIKQNGIDGNDLFVVFESEAPQDDELNIDKAKLLADNGAITINELRHTFGHPALDNGDNLVEVTNRTEVRQDG